MKIIKNKVFKLLVALFILGVILGIISYFLIDNESIKLNMNNYFEVIKNNQFNYNLGIIKSLYTNYKYLIIIFISGIILIGILIAPIVIILNGILLGISTISIIVLYNIKGLFLMSLLLIPCILINQIIYIFASYYSINFNIRLYRTIKSNKLINIKYFSKNYFYIFIIFIIILTISSFFEIFISSNLIKLVV